MSFQYLKQFYLALLAYIFYIWSRGSFFAPIPAVVERATKNPASSTHAKMDFLPVISTHYYYYYLEGGPSLPW
jgi:hypothetical protein